jgi:hypothetical protein
MQHECPKCHGEKEITITVTDPKGNVTTPRLTCIWCDGEGTVSDERLAMIKAEEDMWCTCEKPSEDWDYHPDGEPGAKCYKHHYTCQNCGGVTQTG